MSRQHRRIAAAIGAALTVVAVAGCGSTVDGTAVAGGPASSGTPSGDDVDLAARALSASDFPASYPATPPPAAQMSAALADITGALTPGMTVDPANCAPASLKSDAEHAVVYIATGTAGTLTVATVKVDDPLDQNTVMPCASYSTSTDGAVAKISTTSMPPSPVQSEKSVAFRRVSQTGTARTMTTTTTVLVAQNGRIRVYATYLTFGTGKMDGQILDQMFTKAVQKSRG